jgi:hypothetical protein
MQINKFFLGLSVDMRIIRRFHANHVICQSFANNWDNIRELFIRSSADI